MLALCSRFLKQALSHTQIHIHSKMCRHLQWSLNTHLLPIVYANGWHKCMLGNGSFCSLLCSPFSFSLETYHSVHAKNDNSYYNGKWLSFWLILMLTSSLLTIMTITHVTISLGALLERFWSNEKLTTTENFRQRRGEGETFVIIGQYRHEYCYSSSRLHCAFPHLNSLNSTEALLS